MDKLSQNIESLVKAYFNETNAVTTNATNLGLDNRICKLKVSVDEEYIAVTQGYNERMLEYYGGFDYVSGESKHLIGGYVFYTGDDNRVNEAIVAYQNYINSKSKEK
jgi:hypothetical protein